jgi:hypothetical protein
MTTMKEELQKLVAVQFENWHRSLETFEETLVHKEDEEINDKVSYIFLSVNLLL